MVPDSVFGFDVVTECEGVPAEMMQPGLSWRDAAAYETTAKKLADSFRENFAEYAAAAGEAVVAAGPQG